MCVIERNKYNWEEHVYLVVIQIYGWNMFNSDKNMSPVRIDKTFWNVCNLENVFKKTELCNWEEYVNLEVSV